MAEEEEIDRELIPKLFKAWKTLNKMMEDRGYAVQFQSKDVNFDQWEEEIFRKMDNKLLGIYSKSSDPSIRLYFEYISGEKLNNKNITDFIKKMDESKASSGIIIYQGILSTQAKSKIQEINVELQTESFSLSELMVNITEHELVPKHVLLSKEEKEKLLKRYKIKTSQLPKILVEDPVARYLGLKRGDVVKIIRASETSGRYITYRIAC